MSPSEEIKYGLIPLEIWKNEKPIEIFKKMVARDLPAPPIGESFDFLLTEIEPGRAVFEGKPHGKFYNPLGTIHGGFICTLLDSAMACAIHATLDVGKGSTSVEIKVNFVRPIFEKTGALKAVGEVVNVGRQIASSEGKLIGADGKLYAHGTTTCFIFDL
ncbi:MAG TPA: PaaI family thioesterase [Pyrinomonadaceae bacterium]|nr:PaaI family thioesterase [Pyrinomonadaceae bacterium]